MFLIHAQGVANILNWIKYDVQTLHACMQISNQWKAQCSRELYRDPCTLIHDMKYDAKYTKVITIKLLKTLERSLKSKSRDQQYHLYLRTIDLGWIESVLNFVQRSPHDSSYGSQVAQLLWSLVSNECSNRLVDLRTHKTSLTVLIPRDIQLPLLRALQIKMETFDEAEASVIIRACPSLRKLHISTQTLCGEQLARVITSLGQNRLQELQVKCVDFSSIYTTIEALVDSQSGSLTSVSFDVDQFHMNRSEEIEVEHIHRAFERLGECSGLHKLELRGMTSIGDECMVQIFDGARRLQEVTLQSLDISNQSWDRLLTRSSGHLKSLRLHSKEGRITGLLSSLSKHGRGIHTLDISSLALLPQELREVRWE
ncbi:hypothetical protein K7432_006320 [Basidiobolus ranarum]|uniref:Uncharacterized protein n=1 Tax=Basidiobolus ranarum TaxID=34480 RepID=A0ABR2WV46_9FUNG